MGARGGGVAGEFAIVGGAARGVAEDLVGGVDRFHRGFGVGGAGGVVGVVFAGEGAVGGLDDFDGGVAGDFERVVVGGHGGAAASRPSGR
jgi:hypothetical protein